MFFCTSCPMFWARPAQTRAKGAVRAPLETAARGYTPWIPNRDTPWVALRRRQVGCLGNLTVGVCLGGESGLCRAAAKGTRPRRFASSSRRTTDNRARRVLATTRCCPLRDEGFSPRSWHSPLVGPHVAILIAWGMAAAGSVARLLTASGGTMGEVVAEIRGVQGGGTPWRRFLGPPVALGRGLGQAAPSDGRTPVHEQGAGCRAERLQIGIKTASVKNEAVRRTGNDNLPPTVTPAAQAPPRRSGGPGAKTPQAGDQARAAGPRRLGEPMTKSVKKESWANRAGPGANAAKA